MPGLRFVGGKAVAKTSSNVPLSFSLAGSGELIEDALASCLGEAVERLSQVERPGDVVKTRPLTQQGECISTSLRRLIEDALHRKQLAPETPIDWIRAVDLHGGGPVDVPADWCLRRGSAGPLFDPAAALSTGVAAGTSFDDAAGRAILELIERDAAALWWHGAIHGRPMACEGAAMAEGTQVLRRLRDDNAMRASWLLDISSDLGVPVVAALSFDRDGSDMACGLGAARTAATAARKAILELGQMELGLQLTALKRRKDETSLSDGERHQLKRAAEIRADTCALLHPRGIPRAEGPERDPGLDALRALLAKHRMKAAVIDHTRPGMALSVVQVICPELQPLPSSHQTARLCKVIEATGGNAWSWRTPLL
jgi:ribosomal protein S12 methylthiotransferase accessory factor